VEVTSPVIETSDELQSDTTSQEPENAAVPKFVAPEPAVPEPAAPEPAVVAKATAPAIVPPAVPSVVSPPLSNSKERSVQVLLPQLQGYFDAMNPPKIINEDEGGRQQYSLFNTIRSIMNEPDPTVFSTKWNTLLIFVNQRSNTLFNMTNMYRFPNNWPGSEGELSIFRRLMWLVMETAHPQTRKQGLRDINMERALAGLTETQRSNVINFYS
jgi:hypothetical protein